jgi:hypothetical protein
MLQQIWWMQEVGRTVSQLSHACTGSDSSRILGSYVI